MHFTHKEYSYYIVVLTSLKLHDKIYLATNANKISKKTLKLSSHYYFNLNSNLHYLNLNYTYQCHILLKCF